MSGCPSDRDGPRASLWAAATARTGCWDGCRFLMPAVSIGLAAPFARPGRTALTLAAVVLGATAVSFAVGLTSSLRLVTTGLSHEQAQPVQIYVPGAGGGPPITAGASVDRAPSPRVAQHAIEAALSEQPGTSRFVAQVQQTATVPGLIEQVPVTAFRGNATWTGYDLVSGHWYSGPDEVDVPDGVPQRHRQVGRRQSVTHFCSTATRFGRQSSERSSTRATCGDQA